MRRIQSNKMKKERAGVGSLIRNISGVVYKANHKCSEFVTRLSGVRNDSWGLVVFENGIVKEIAAI